MIPTHLSLFDHFIIGADSILKTITHSLMGTGRPLPTATEATADLSAAEQQHAGGLMRVNYTGEIAAQGLYLGQALVAHNPVTRAALLQAAQEEQDHLLWCQQRLKELHTHTSYLNPFWFIGSLSIGIMAGLISDKYSLGFVVETERQVEIHLTGHLNQLPANDASSRAILLQMALDEQQHAQNAKQQGAAELPELIKYAMRIPAKIMTTIAYYI